MSVLNLDRRPDGSRALFIDGDLQFDSRDERIYHESLVLPALALADHGQPEGLRVLICGGGDGLAAREACKSPAVRQIDLVDYDPQVVAMARSAWPDLHDGALADPRLTVHHADAWAFAEAAATTQHRYDLIVVDLTVPQDLTAAAFHSVEWYALLASLLTPTGALAVNGLSPSATPEAYWTPYNAMRTAGLHAKPYRIALPSFSAQGYGPDWGFFLATTTPLTAGKVEALSLAAPRQALHDTAHLRRLFVLPADVAELRGSVAPVRRGDDTLLRRLGQQREASDSEATWDAMADPVDAAPLLPPTAGGVLPEPVREAIAAAAVDGDVLLERVLAVMPALQPQHTRTMIDTLLQDPAKFLAPIDLAGLIDRLLERAAELPARVVSELRHLKVQLGDLLADTGALLRLGLRVVTVVVVVVIVANLIYPDSAYGKGGGSHVGDSGSFTRSSHIAAGSQDEPTVARGTGFRQNPRNSHRAVDESGAIYPSRRFRFGPHYYWAGSHHYGHRQHQAAPSDQPAEAESIYRLSPEADVLDDGRIALTLTERTFLIVDSETVQVVDKASGAEVMVLNRPENLAFRLSRELERQRLGLVKTIKAKQAWNAWVSWVSFTPWYSGDQTELQNLRRMQDKLANAQGLLGFTPRGTVDPLPPPVPGAHEIFTSVWLMPDGSGVLARMPDGAVAWLTDSSWQALPGTPGSIDGRYPAGFRSAVTDVLATMVKDAEGTYKSLYQDLSDLQKGLAGLQRDLGEYNQIAASSGSSESVEYGAIDIPCSEAIRRTEAEIAATRQQIQELETRLGDWPRDVYNARQVLLAFGRNRGPS
jgi:spermidine synthase